MGAVWGRYGMGAVCRYGMGLRFSSRGKFRTSCTVVRLISPAPAAASYDVAVAAKPPAMCAARLPTWSSKKTTSRPDTTLGA